MDLILVRHCEPVYGDINNIEYEELSKAGIECATCLATSLQQYNIDVILSSPLSRAVQTATIIGKKLKIPVVVDDDLMEWKTEVKLQRDKDSFHQLFKEFAKFQGKHNNDCVFKWENIDELGARFFSVLEKYSDSNKQYLIVGHKMLFGQIIDSRNMNYGDIIRCNYYGQKWNGFVEEYLTNS